MPYAGLNKPATLRRLLPIERTLLPLVKKANGEYRQKYHDSPEPHHAQGIVGNCPREKKGNFEIEQNEENGNQVIAHIELHARIVECLEAALVRRQFFGIGAMRPQYAPDRDKRKANARGNNNKQQYGKILLQVHAMHPTVISKPLDCIILRMHIWGLTLF